MKVRCDNPNATGYANYGGRGIKVCDRWRTSFAAFLADMGPKPSPKHSIDRIDNDRGYERGNCRWATPKEQRRNSRTFVMTPERLTDLRLHVANGGSVFAWTKKNAVAKSTAYAAIS